VKFCKLNTASHQNNEAGFCVSAIPVNKVLLQELNRFIGIEMLTSNFLTFLVLSPNFKGGGKTHFGPSADTHESSPPHLLKNKMSLKKFQVIWQP